MAAGQENSMELKRKQAPYSKGKGKESNPKKFKSNSGYVSQKGPSKPFNSSKPPPAHHQKLPNSNDSSDSKKQRRVQAKELSEARKKKRKKHFTLQQELAVLWEKIRRRDISKEDRSKFVTEALNKMKGKISEIACSHISSRVLQSCFKHCSEDERALVFLELRPHFIELATNPYAVHLLAKMFDQASKDQLGELISSLHGHVATLLRHTAGSLVVEQAFYQGNSIQKQALLSELFSPELKLFQDLVSIKDTKDSSLAKIDNSSSQSSTLLSAGYRLPDVISKLKLRKSTVRQHMANVLQPILEKGILDHSIIHRTLMEYLTIADESSAADVIQHLSGSSLVRMIHTKDGARVAMLCLRHGTAKDWKKIVKGLKGRIEEIAREKYGTMALVAILSTVDDTKLLTKLVIRDLEGMLKELVMDQGGRRPILQLLNPNCPRYFSQDDLLSLSLSIPSLCEKEKASLEDEDTGVENEKSTGGVSDESDKEGKTVRKNKIGKKDPLTRRRELLLDSGLGKKLIDTCCEIAGDMLRSKVGNEVLYEIVTGGADRVLFPTLKQEMVKLHEAIASLVAEPKSDGPEENNHLLENFFSSRAIRKLVLECPEFATTLWEKALQGNSAQWSQGHSAKVISAFMEASDSATNDMAKRELQPLIEKGLLKLPTKDDSKKTKAVKKTK